ncbi:hypothetical protein AZ036_004135 [Klebsiella michiganensis]|uniref:Host cell division inhibitor Icd-like protein n=2 Tax=Klebsiella michiganensis TaxID=1134687 RepID=A0ABR5G6Y9_9ENTR|nr:hypothetical protein L387_04073 [Klebsiella michiganensis]KLY25868.1 hypothetical protein SK91_05780 [Klebsiella michiganensis]OUG36885.1 hypothetical protein AZ036_004135 [Klebsiella michiganensis]
MLSDTKSGVINPASRQNNRSLCLAGYSASLGFLRCRCCNSLRATLMICWISSSALRPISSIRFRASMEDSSKVSSLPSFCLRVISQRIAVTMKPAVDSPANFTDSISVKTSCGTRTFLICDLLLTLPVAIRPPVMLGGVIHYSNKCAFKSVDMDAHLISNEMHTLSTTETQVRHKKAKPGSGGTLTGPLTTSVIISNEVAMSNRTTSFTGRASISPTLFTWRFLALNRHDKKAKPCRLSVDAATEREARSILSPHFILSLAARLPVQEVADVEK